ncbi:MAG TPA: hypothetical protein VN962_13550 [Polyangia bacterium]|nr:hypothetical protein [Polyangia bacterium]
MKDRHDQKVEALPFPESICHRCANSRVISTKTSDFLMCTALPTKYPRQPVLHCPAFDPKL